MTAANTDYDTPWKQLVETYFQEFIQFFFPNYYTLFNWNKGYEFLDKELKQVVQDAELGRRYVDKLVKIWRTNGDETWILVHLEVQNERERDFAKRMFVYNYRIFDRYEHTVVSLAVLGDDNPNWRPSQFGYELLNCRMAFEFPIVKLFDYQARWSELEQSINPFAIVVMAHLKAKETTQNREQRKVWKLRLIKSLYQKGYERTDIINLFTFLDWLLSLPEALEKQFWQELNQFEEERKMPYITSVERIGMEKGLQEGRQEGLREGRQEATREWLIKAIRLGLQLKFGDIALSLISEIESLEDLSLLETIFNRLSTDITLEQIRQLYQ